MHGVIARVQLSRRIYEDLGEVIIAYTSMGVWAGDNSFKSFAKLQYNFEVGEFGEGVFERDRRGRKKSV